MWKRSPFLLCLIVILSSCSTKPPDNPDSIASLCQVLRNRIAAADGDHDSSQFMDTMKRKNPVDQAELMREYYSYDCPVIVDFTPPP
jgi:hypothetical protein